MFGGGLVELPESGYALALSIAPGESFMGHQDSAILAELWEPSQAGLPRANSAIHSLTVT